MTTNPTTTKDAELALFRAMLHLDDKLFELLEGSPDQDLAVDGMEEHFMRARKALCAVIGHRVEADHCGRPEHDFCMMCNESFPGQADGRTQ